METSALSFARPAVLNALWLLPLLAALFWWAERRRRTMIGRIVAPKLRALLAGNTSTARRWFRGACVLTALGLLVVTLAGPRLGYDTLEVPHRGRDVIIAMDVSRSMLAPDVAPSRLERAKLLAEDLVSELGADRIGLVAFAGSAFLQAPLTLDHGAVLAALDELDTQLIPRGGTNIAAAIRTATEAFGKAEGFSRALVIISDGEELDADGLSAAKQAAADGIRIFTVGVGSAEGSEIPLGPGDFVRDPSGKIVQSRLDSARMSQIAEATGGFYTPLDDNAARLLASDGIGKLAEADFSVNASRRPIERYQWPLAVAIGLLMLQAMVGERRRRVAVAAALWITASSALAAPAGVDAYNSGDYEKARQLFERRLHSETHVPFLQADVPALQLNAGAAAYRLKDYAKAAEYFSRATLAENPAIRSDAEFNFGNTLFRQGEGQADKEKTKADWKDAIAKYEAALKTRPEYKEAKENKERVEQLLKELEKKQEQEKQQQKKNNEQKQDQQQKDQQKQDQQQSGGGQKDKQEKQDKQDQGKDQQQQQQQSGGEKKEEKKEEQKHGDQGQKDQQDQGKQPGEQKQGDKSGEKDAQQQAGAEGEKKDEGQGQGGEKQQGETPKPEEKDGGQPGDARPQSGQPGEKPAPVPEQSGEKKQGEVRGAQQGEGGEQEEAATVVEAEKEEDGKMSESQARALLRALQGEEEKVNLRERRNFQDVSRDW